MDTRDVAYIAIAFVNDIRNGDDDPALIIGRPELDALLANPLVRNYADRWLKNRMQVHVQV